MLSDEAVVPRLFCLVGPAAANSTVTLDTNAISLECGPTAAHLSSFLAQPGVSAIHLERETIAVVLATLGAALGAALQHWVLGQ